MLVDKPVGRSSCGFSWSVWNCTLHTKTQIALFSKFISEVDLKPENVLWSPSLGCGYDLPFPGRMLTADTIRCPTWQIHSLLFLKIPTNDIHWKYQHKIEVFLSENLFSFWKETWCLSHFLNRIFRNGWEKIKDGRGGRLEDEGEGASEGNLEHLWVHHHPCLPGWSLPWIRSKNFKCHLWSV